MGTHSVSLKFDGGIKGGNPGGLAIYGYVASGNQGFETAGNGIIGQDEDLTSNLAEYIGLQKGLQEVLDETSPDQIHILGDSELVIGHLTGDYEFSSSRLRPFYDRVSTQIETADASFQFQCIDRSANTDAHEHAERSYERFTYEGEVERALTTPMEVTAVGKRKYKVDGQRVNAQAEDCDCDIYQEHGYLCIHIFKVRLLERGDL